MTACESKEQQHRSSVVHQQQQHKKPQSVRNLLRLLFRIKPTRIQRRLMNTKLVLFPMYAKMGEAEDSWHVRLNGWCYQPLHSDSLRLKTISAVGGWLGMETTVVTERVSHIVSTNTPSLVVSFSLVSGMNHNPRAPPPPPRPMRAATQRPSQLHQLAQQQQQQRQQQQQQRASPSLLSSYLSERIWLQYWSSIEFNSDYGCHLESLEMARSDNDGKLTGTIHIPLDKLPLSPAAMVSNPPKHLLLTGHAIPDVYQSLVDIKAAASVVLIPPTGISVITDIDDTIKITGIADGKIIAAQKSMTALQEAVAGMANRYIKWYEEDSAAFHYVSAGHRGLYTALLADFLRDNGFPPGSVHLQEGSVINGAMGERSKGYKIQVITRILEDFPQRHFILVGDNGQKDMEVYEEIYRKYPHQVKKILIRDAKQLEPVAPLGTEQQVRRALQSVSTNSSLQTLANVSRAAMASPTPSFSRGLTRINTASSSSTPSTPPNGSILSVATVVGIDGEPLVRLFNDGNQLLHMDIKIFTSSTTTTLTTANHVPFKLNHGSSSSSNNTGGDIWSPPVANLIDL